MKKNISIQTGKGPFWLNRLEQRMPDAIRKLEIYILLRLTAKACRQKAPSIRGMTGRESLAIYQTFTAEILAGPDTAELRACRRAMYQKAWRTGRMLALLPGLRQDAAKKRLIRLLYRNIGIILEDQSLSSPGTNSRSRLRGVKLSGPDYEKQADQEVWNIHIPRCSFSRCYTPRTCYVMSGFDAGIICGIFGGGSLRFSRRITEGHPSCKAAYTYPRQPGLKIPESDMQEVMK